MHWNYWASSSKFIIFCTKKDLLNSCWFAERILLLIPSKFSANAHIMHGSQVTNNVKVGKIFSLSYWGENPELLLKMKFTVEFCCERMFSIQIISQWSQAYAHIIMMAKKNCAFFEALVRLCAKAIISHFSDFSRRDSSILTNTHPTGTSPFTYPCSALRWSA